MVKIYILMIFNRQATLLSILPFLSHQKRKPKTRPHSTFFIISLVNKYNAQNNSFQSV